MENNLIEKFIQNLLPLKIPTNRFLAIVLLVSLFAILAPSNLLQNLSLLEFTNNNKTIISTVLIFTLAYFVIELMYKTFDKIQDFNNSRKQNELLNNLPKSEKDIVIRMYNNGHSYKWSPTSPKIGSLCAKGIIYQSTTIGYQDSFGYTLQPWVAKYIDKHEKYIIK